MVQVLKRANLIIRKSRKKFENSNKNLKERNGIEILRKKNLGGGEISIFKGKLFEKYWVNISTVHKFSKQVKKYLELIKIQIEQVFQL